MKRCQTKASALKFSISVADCLVSYPLWSDTKISTSSLNILTTSSWFSIYYCFHNTRIEDGYYSRFIIYTELGPIVIHCDKPKMYEGEKRRWYIIDDSETGDPHRNNILKSMRLWVILGKIWTRIISNTLFSSIS